MIKLIETYSLSEIIIFLVTFALAVKGIVAFWDWTIERLRKVLKKENQKEKDREIIKKLVQQQDEFEKTLNNITDKINLLIQSDKDDIKSYITKEHHFFCYEKKWIDDYSLDCIEKRYNHYQQEGGNSFIKELMNELRNLPKQSPH